MKVDVGRGNPIWISPRRGNSITIIQGTSRIYVGADEIGHLIEVMKRMAEL